MKNEKRLDGGVSLNNKAQLIDRRHIRYTWWQHQDGTFSDGVTLQSVIEQLPVVDAVELPKGKPGDYLEWDNGTGFKQIYCINSVMICEDCMRYELANFTPVVNHPNIVRIMSQEEAEKEWRNMVNDERKAEDYQSLKAVP